MGARERCGDKWSLLLIIGDPRARAPAQGDPGDRAKNWVQEEETPRSWSR